MVGVTGSIPVPPTIQFPPNLVSMASPEFLRVFRGLCELSYLCCREIPGFAAFAPNSAPGISAPPNSGQRNDAWWLESVGPPVEHLLPKMTWLAGAIKKRRSPAFRRAQCVTSVLLQSVKQNGTLLFPSRGQGAGLAQPLGCKCCGVISRQDALDDIGCQKGD